MWKMTLLFALAAAAAIGSVQPGTAQYEGPWCAYLTIGEGSTIQRCDMRSFEMCLAEIRTQGGGGHCTQNPRYSGAEPAGARKRRP